MTTNVITVNSNTYSFCTGTNEQPDVVSIFYKHGNGPNDIEIVDEQIVNSLDYSPCKFTYASLRVEEAAKKILSEVKLGLFRDNSEFGNAFKNLFRGAVQFIPFAGNGALYLYDLIRVRFFVHPQIKSALNPLPENVMGIALDGKIVASFSPEPLLRRQPDNVMGVLHAFWLIMLTEEMNGKDSAINKCDLAIKFAKRLERA